MSKQTKKILLIVSIVLIVLAIPLTVFLLQRQQESRSQAAKSTTLSFTPTSSSGSPITATVGSTIPLHVMIAPGANQVSFMQLEVTYDSTLFQPDPAGPFTVNTTTFPGGVISQPVITPGNPAKMTVQMSIGSDPTKAVQILSDAGVVNMKVLAAGAGISQISFGAQTQVLSLAPQDGPAENVLSSTSPAFVTVPGAPNTPTPTPIADRADLVVTSMRITSQTGVCGPLGVEVTVRNQGFATTGSFLIRANNVDSTPVASLAPSTTISRWINAGTSSPTTGVVDPLNTVDEENETNNTLTQPLPIPTLSPSCITPTLTPTPSPTNSPTPTRTPTPFPPTLTPTRTPTPGGTALNLTIFMHNIGNSGDNVNPTSSTSSNKNPQTPTRTLTYSLTGDNNVQLNGTVPVTYNSTNGNFVGSIGLTSGFAQGIYELKLKSTQHLQVAIANVRVTTGAATAVRPVTFITGDINNDNALNILDYNILLGCVQDDGATCGNNFQQADLNDDDFVNHVDYTLFLREMSVQPGQ